MATSHSTTLIGWEDKYRTAKEEASNIAFYFTMNRQSAKRNRHKTINHSYLTIHTTEPIKKVLTKASSQLILNVPGPGRDASKEDWNTAREERLYLMIVAMGRCHEK